MDQSARMMTRASLCSSIWFSSRRFWFRTAAAMAGASLTRISPMPPLARMPWMRRTTDRTRASRVLTLPVPVQVGQVSWFTCWRLGRMRWRVMTSTPKRLIFPTSMRALSALRQSTRQSCTERMWDSRFMSMKSMAMRPARSRSRSWRATSSAASMLVLKAMSSTPSPEVLPLLTSMATRASVWSSTRAPPLGRGTFRP